VNAFTDYEKAMRWILSTEDDPNEENPSCKEENSSGGQPGQLCETGQNQQTKGIS
jgi:hypothetical protein